MVDGGRMEGQMDGQKGGQKTPRWYAEVSLCPLKQPARPVQKGRVGSVHYMPDVSLCRDTSCPSRMLPTEIGIS